MHASNDPARRGRTRQFAALVRESLQTSDRDLTEGPIRRTLVLLAIPMVLEMAMESIFAIVDIFWVAKLGPNAVAVVGLTEAMLSIVYAVCIGFGMAVTASVARRIGEKRPDDAASIAGQAIWVSAVLATIIGIFGAVYADSLLRLMGAGPGVIDGGSGYTRVPDGRLGQHFLYFRAGCDFPRRRRRGDSDAQPLDC